MEQTALGLFTASIAEAWRPPPDVSRADWCASNLVMPTTTSATPGFYDLERYSYWRGVLEASEDPEVEKIVILAATQLGKTTLLMAVLAALAALSPIPAMLGTPDKPALRELRDKFYEMCDASSCLRDQIPPPRLRNDRWIDVGRMRAHLAYARNTQSMSGKSCGLVVKTEIDRWKKTKTHGDPSSMIDERVKAFYRSLIIEESTPSDENSRIFAAYEQSDRRRYLVPCPKCGHHQELRFFPLRKGPNKGRGGVAGIKNRDGHWLKPDQVLESAYYLCEYKGCRIDSEQKPAIVERGVWVPAGQSIDKRGKISGTPLRSKRIWGGRLNSLYADTVSFGRMAAKYLEARDDVAKLQQWWNDWLGDRWTRRAKVPKWKELGRRLKGPTERGRVPSWAIFLTAGADPGPNYVRWVVRAWGEGSTSELVDWGTCHQTSPALDSHLRGLIGAVIGRLFPLSAANPAGHRSLGVRLLNIDCGHAPHTVHNFVRSLKVGDRVRQVVGKDALAGGENWRSNLVQRSARDGKPYAGGQTRWEINRAVFNQDLHERWRLPLGEPGAWQLTSADLRHCEEYLRELVNEGPVKTRNKRGREVTVWQKLQPNTGNHYWDCEVYASAAADMVTGGEWEGLAEQARAAAGDDDRRGRERSDAGDVAAREHPSDFSAR